MLRHEPGLLLQRVWLTSNLHIEVKKDRVGRRQVDQPPCLLWPAMPSAVDSPVAVLL